LEKGFHQCRTGRPLIGEGGVWVAGWQGRRRMGGGADSAGPASLIDGCRSWSFRKLFRADPRDGCRAPGRLWGRPTAVASVAACHVRKATHRTTGGFPAKVGSPTAHVGRHHRRECLVPPHDDLEEPLPGPLWGQVERASVSNRDRRAQPAMHHISWSLAALRNGALCDEHECARGPGGGPTTGVCRRFPATPTQEPPARSCGRPRKAVRSRTKTLGLSIGEPTR
jgi:hypothetical protein